MTVGNWAWSPDGKWIAFSATRIYERSIYLYDLWLISSDAQRLIRVTSAPPDDFAVHWSPDGTRLAFWRDGVGLVILSLESGESTAVGIDPRFNFTLEGVK